jgi:hypothetical protein
MAGSGSPRRTVKLSMTLEILVTRMPNAVWDNLHYKERGNTAMPKIVKPTSLMNDTHQTLLMNFENVLVGATNLTNEEIQYTQDGEIVRGSTVSLKTILDHPQ